jgi:hypothetical protein
MRGNPGAKGLALREGSCSNPVPDARMSVSVGFMVGIRVVFCVVVSPVLGSSIPIVSKLILQCSAPEPLEAHIHHLAPARNNSIINNSGSCGVVRLDRAFGLGPAHVGEGLAVGNHLACSDEQGSQLSFCS